MILLDLKILKMDGIIFLENLDYKKYVVIIISNYVSDDSEFVTVTMNLDAIEYFALHFSNVPAMFASFKIIK